MEERAGEKERLINNGCVERSAYREKCFRFSQYKYATLDTKETPRGYADPVSLYISIACISTVQPNFRFDV